jgi:C1A family cysteine protease
MQKKQLVKMSIILIALFISSFPAIAFGGNKILKFEETDNIKTIREKIKHNNYRFTVKENRIFNMSKEKLNRFLGKHPSNQVKSRIYDTGIGPLARHLGKTLPDSFDLRSINQKSYIGPVRNQGGCGSCYAFGAIAAAEAVYNLKYDLYDTNCADFSESYLAFCLSEFFSGFDGCDGADYDYDEVAALTEYGVINEADFPYEDWEQECPLNVSDVTHETVFHSWHRVPCSDIEGIKTAIMTYGAVDAAVYVTSAFRAYDQGIYEDSYKVCDRTYSEDCFRTIVNHGISLIGWNDNGDAENEGYWILRNSWGDDWGDRGYMKIQYESAAVACAAVYVAYESDPDLPVVTSLDSENISSQSADLLGTITTNGNKLSYYFEYGETEKFGYETELIKVPSTNNEVPVSVHIDNLTPGTTYYFRLAAIVNQQERIYGKTKTFTTIKLKPNIEITAESFSINIHSGEVVSESFVIGNSSESSGNLEYSIKLESTGSYQKNRLHYSKILKAVENINAQTKKKKSLKRTAVTKIASRFVSSIHIAILGADSVIFLKELQEALIDTGYFASVTVIDTSMFTPRYSELQLFQSVLLFSSIEYDDPTNLGNAIADYIDNKGGLVTMLYEISNDNNELYSLQGRWNEDNYAVIPRCPIKHGQSALGKIYYPGHFIMNNVHSFVGGTQSFRPTTLTVSQGSERIADWEDGVPLIATKEIQESRIVALGFYPDSNDNLNWDSTTDGFEIIANALYWASNDTPWMTISSSNANIGPGESQCITMTFQATTDRPIEYRANMYIRHNAVNRENPIKIPVSLVVNTANQPPQIVINPESINEIVPKGDIVSKTLNVMNTGSQQLIWSLAPLCDSGAYQWIDSDTNSNISFNWVDISQTGTVVTGLTDDVSVGPYPIGFNFPFFGKDFQTFFISSNGFLQIGDSSKGYEWNNLRIPDDRLPNNIIAWFWDDLLPLHASVHYQTIDDKLIVQIENVERYQGTGNLGAQIIMGSDGSIIIQYKTISDAFNTESCTVGIENEDGTKGLEILFNSKKLHENLAIKIFKDSSCPWLSVNPVTGVTDKNKSTKVNVLIDTQALDIGNHSARIDVKSNDPVKPLVNIPIEIEVLAQNALYAKKDLDAVTKEIKTIIVFDHVPPYNNRIQDLEGHVMNVIYDQFGVAIYIYIDGWNNKPYKENPLTAINNDGTWRCDITTGGKDHLATKIAAFLIPVDGEVPIVQDSKTLPEALDKYPGRIIERFPKTDK